MSIFSDIGKFLGFGGSSASTSGNGTDPGALAGPGSGESLVPGGKAAQQFNRNLWMDNTKYQRQVADMKKAGLNPAVMFGSGSSASSAGIGGSSNSDNPVDFARKAQDGIKQARENKLNSAERLANDTGKDLSKDEELTFIDELLPLIAI